MITNKGNLTINDTVGTGVINGVGGNNYNIAIWADGGKVTIAGGTITNKGATGGENDTQFDLIYVKNGGEVVITGGMFIAENPAWTLNVHNTTGGKITVSGGEFVGYDPMADDATKESFLAEGLHAADVDGDGIFTLHEIVTVTDAAVAPTCVATGLTEGSHCSVCDKILVAQEVVEATGHAEETVAGKAPTCTATGLTDGTKCSVCGETITAQTEIPALGHAEETVAGKAPTCTATGLTDGTKCSVCGETIIAQTEIPALGHSYTYVPNADGETHDATCGTCGDTFNAAHTSTDGICTACGAEEKIACEHIDENADAKCDLCGELNVDESLAFSATPFNLGADIQAILQVKHVKASSTFVIDTYKVFATKNGVETEVGLLVANENSKKTIKTYGFSLTVAAKEMTDVVSLRIVATNNDGKVYSSAPINWTAKQAIIDALNSEINKTDDKTINKRYLLVNMLAYGAAAQNYFGYNNGEEQLATYNLPDAFKPYLVTETPDMETIAKTNDSTQTYKHKKYAFNLSSRVEVISQYTINRADNKNDFKAVVVQTHIAPDGTETTREYTINGADCLKSGTTFGVYFKDFNSHEMRDTITVTLYKGNTVVNQAQTFSAESVLASGDVDAALAKAMMIYGDCAWTYFDK